MTPDRVMELARKACPRHRGGVNNMYCYCREIAAAIQEAVEERDSARCLTMEEQRELQSVLRTLSDRGPVLIASAKELVRLWEEQKAKLSEQANMIAALKGAAKTVLDYCQIIREEPEPHA